MSLIFSPTPPYSILYSLLFDQNPNIITSQAQEEFNATFRAEFLLIIGKVQNWE